jgi:hypothetical protein
MPALDTLRVTSRPGQVDSDDPMGAARRERRLLPIPSWFIALWGTSASCRGGSRRVRLIARRVAESLASRVPPRRLIAVTQNSRKFAETDLAGPYRNSKWSASSGVVQTKFPQRHGLHHTHQGVTDASARRERLRRSQNQPRKADSSRSYMCGVDTWWRGRTTCEFPRDGGVLSVANDEGPDHLRVDAAMDGGRSNFRHDERLFTATARARRS